MTVSTVVLPQPPCFSSVAGVGIVDAYPSSSSSSGVSFCNITVRGVSLRSRKVCGAVKVTGFSDQGYLQYYNRGVVRCGEKKKDKESSRKKLKLLKNFSEDLSTLSGMGGGAETDDSSVGDVEGKLISEAAQLLLKQLKEQKELKRKKKEEKARFKAARMKNMLDCESSSDSECEEVIDMRNQAVAVPMVGESEQASQEEAALITLPILPTPNSEINDFQDVDHHKQYCDGPSTTCRNASAIVCNDMNSLGTRETSMKRIEVCMGNKCKKSGAAALLEEFERIMGLEGAVVGCKCMGKCRDGPNVRLLNSLGDDFDGTPPNPLCIGVGLEDAGIIVASYFGEDRKDLGITPEF